MGSRKTAQLAQARDKAGPSPVDRRKGGLKRSVATEAAGIPLGIVSAAANRHDSPLLEPTLAAALAQVGPMPQHVTGHLYYSRGS